MQVLLESFHDSADIFIEAFDAPEICGEILSLTDGDVISGFQRKGIRLADLHSGDVDSEPGITMLIERTAIGG